MKISQTLRSFPALTILVFGILAVIFGITGLLAPNTLLATLGFEVITQSQRASHDYTLVYLTASAMASLNMGAYYILAALTGTRAFFGWTVPFRCLTFVVFMGVVFTGNAPGSFALVAVWELVGALATGTALWYENRKRTSQG